MENTKYEGYNWLQIQRQRQVLKRARAQRIKRGDLLPWFIQNHDTLPAWYLEDCKKFFEDIKKDVK